MKPLFPPYFPSDVERFIMRLLSSELSTRPTAEEALKDLLFSNVTDEFTYEVYSDGRVVEVASGGACPQQPEAAVAVPEEEGPGDAAAEGAAIADVMEVMRGKEDNGDGAGKDAAAEDK
jgi:hypothetical protein